MYTTLIGWRDRKERITNSGMEVTLTVYVEPYTAAPIVISNLLGRVDKPATRTSCLPMTTICPFVIA